MLSSCFSHLSCSRVLAPFLTPVSSLTTPLTCQPSQPNSPHSTTQHNTRWHNTTQHSTTQHSIAQHITTQHNSPHNTTQHNTTQHNTEQHTAQHNTAQHPMTQTKLRPEETETMSFASDSLISIQYCARVCPVFSHMKSSCWEEM